MGKRRERTKWSQVAWIQEPIKEEAPVHREREPQPPNSKYWRSPPSSYVAPRFARSKYPATEQFEEEVTVEELPDGYTKIRSKNLDVIFKKEFYQRKMDQGMASLAAQGHQVSGDKVCFEELDLNRIPEFRPRQGTGVESINDSGYSTSLSSSFQDASFLNDQLQYPQHHHEVQVHHQPQQQFHPQPSHFVPTIPMSVPPPLGQTPSQFYLYSPATNTLIPCEEIMVGQTISSSDGILYQGETKAYVAYPVHGPEGSGYITQPFVHPNYGSGSEDQPQKLEARNEKDQDLKQGSDVNPSHAKERNETRRKASLSSALPCAVAEKTQLSALRPEPVYIPGLVTSPTVKKVKKRRKKKPKTKNESSKMNNSSSESEGKDHGHGLEVGTLKSFEEEMFTFVEEPINEINLTDDLANSLLNPPTEDDDMETTIARDILNIVETEVEEEFVSEDNASLKSDKGNSVNVVNEDASSKVEETKEIVTLEIETKPIVESGKLPEETKFVTKTKKKAKKQPKNEMSICKPQSPELMDKKQDEDVKNLGEEKDLALDDSAAAPADLVKDDVTVQEECPNEEALNEGKAEEVLNMVPAKEEEAVKGDDFKFDVIKEDAKEEEANKENKPRRRRKRGAKDRGGNANNQPLQRVLVIDDQVDIRYHRPNGPLTPSKAEISPLENISPSTIYKEIIVKDLGLGMFRGVMELGRPFLGYYRPPDRREYELADSEEKEEIEAMEIEQD